MDSEEEKLSEEDFIHEGYSQNPFPFWLWVFLLAVLVALILGTQTWYSSYRGRSLEGSPFLQVTNREFSLFLWQNSEFLRSSVKGSEGYLPSFPHPRSASFSAGKGDEFVQAAPEVLFRYHAWERQIKNKSPMGKIPPDEFLEFIDELPEWNPTYWKTAPEGYVKLMETIPFPIDDLQKLSEKQLPFNVRIAFQGWKNFMVEGDAINKMEITVADVRSFLLKYPNYSRPYWRNIISLNYLKGLRTDPGEKVLSNEEMAPFLRVALFNERSAS